MPEPRRVTMLVRNAFTHDTRVEKEAATLRRAGYRVTVVADAGAGLPQGEELDGIHVRRVSRRLARVPLLRYLAGELARIGVLVRTRPDLLHAHDSNALLAVAVAAWRTGSPFVYDAHELWLGRPRRERSGAYFWLSQAWYAILQRLLVPRAAACLTVSAPIARHLAEAYRLEKVWLVENFPEADVAADPRALQLRDLPGGELVPDDAPIVLYVGGLMDGRGLEALVDAMPHVRGAHLVLLGDGPLGDPLLARARRLGVAERVQRLGPVPSGDVIAYARSAQVGVAPVVPTSLNNRYSLSNKLFQYLAAEVPVVASDLPQIREVVIGARAGVVVDTQRPDALAGAINQLLAEPETAAEMGRRGRQAVLERFNWEQAAGRLLEAYASLDGVSARSPDRP